MKIQGLEERIKQTLSHNKQEIQSKTRTISDLEKENERNINKINRLEKEITFKNDRISQLDQIVEGSKQIFAKQNGIITALRAELQKEKSATGISIEYNRHLEKDIKRLDNEKQELDNRIKELEEQEQNSSGIRDEELNKLREEKQELSGNYDKLYTDTLNILKVAVNLQVISADADDYTVLTTYGNAAVNKITTLTQERDSRPSQEDFKKLEKKLEQELWWDKWINNPNKARNEYKFDGSI